MARQARRFRANGFAHRVGMPIATVSRSTTLHFVVFLRGFSSSNEFKNQRMVAADSLVPEFVGALDFWAARIEDIANACLIRAVLDSHGSWFLLLQLAASYY
ncbi:MAG: hypothetical protein O3A00_12215 [Planctomycetota bacterium]|nr:hypothetical protein [Planctomycetota bacterium]